MSLRFSYLRYTHFIKTRAIFLILLPVFFVLHGFVANYVAVSAIDAFWLALFYITASLAIAGIAWLFYRNLIKASLLALFIMAYHFFFGFIQDKLISLSSHSFVSQYRFILPVSCLLLLVVIIGLRKRKRTLFILTTYLNILLLVVVLIDLGALLFKVSGTGSNSSLNVSPEKFTICDTCKKPDVYFLLLDQYAGNAALKEVFNFDNSPFETELKNRGFHIVQKSRSNYNLTPFSVASTLDMDYLGPGMGTKKHLNVTYSYNIVRNSRAINFLAAHGYQFYNLSVFDFPGQPAQRYSFFPYGTELISSQTFISRLQKSIEADIVSGKLPLESVQKKLLYKHLHFNDDIAEMVRKVAANHSARPKFTYAHFFLPHWPYFYDSKGNPVSIEKLQGLGKTNAAYYIEYLQYSNGKVLQLVDYILSVSTSPPVIILLSDHGFRHPEKEADHNYDFSNLNAVLLPGKNYKLFADNMTNVNFFRIFFNSCFNQQFPLLKDSTINLF